MNGTSRLDELKHDLEALTQPPDPRDAEAKGRAAKTERNRGRNAKDPRQIPGPGWKDITVRTWKEISDNNIFLVAGGVTYALVVALFPTLAALVSIYGLFFDPGQVEQQVKSLSSLLPPETTQMIASELHSLVSTSSRALGAGAIVALLFALWTSSRGMSGMVNALNIAYGQKETRGLVKLNLLAIGLTMLMLVGGVVIIALVGVLPAAVQFLGLGSIAKWLLLILEWPLLIGVVLIGLAVLYRFAPDRKKPRWRWVSSGAIVATVLWVLGSILFSVYVTHFSSYDKTYGSLGGVVVMLTWLWLSAFVALLGAVVNAQTERQTVADSTVSRGRPLGTRHAYAADTVGGRTD